ncbi:MAG: phage tail protein [bacterium]
MPNRHPLEDLLQSHRFWLLDLVPSSTFPFFVLGSPIMGYQSITMPELTLEVDEVKQVNSMYKKYVYSGGSVGAITLMRGARCYDDTFYQWITRALRGIDMVPRNLLLIQFTNINTKNKDDLEVMLPIAIEAWESSQFLPGRVWLLWNAIPTRYKPGSDMDATSGEVSIMELDVQVEAFTELRIFSAREGLAGRF